MANQITGASHGLMGLSSDKNNHLGTPKAYRRVVNGRECILRTLGDGQADNACKFSLFGNHHGTIVDYVKSNAAVAGMSLICILHTSEVKNVGAPNPASVGVNSTAITKEGPQTYSFKQLIEQHDKRAAAADSSHAEKQQVLRRQLERDVSEMRNRQRAPKRHREVLDAAEVLCSLSNPVVTSQLNGSNGEHTNSDDVEDDVKGKEKEKEKAYHQRKYNKNKKNKANNSKAHKLEMEFERRMLARMDADDFSDLRPTKMEEAPTKPPTLQRHVNKFAALADDEHDELDEQIDEEKVPDPSLDAQASSILKNRTLQVAICQDFHVLSWRVYRGNILNAHLQRPYNSDPVYNDNSIIRDGAVATSTHYDGLMRSITEKYGAEIRYKSSVLYGRTLQQYEDSIVAKKVEKLHAVTRNSARALVVARGGAKSSVPDVKVLSTPLDVCVANNGLLQFDGHTYVRVGDLYYKYYTEDDYGEVLPRNVLVLNNDKEHFLHGYSRVSIGHYRHTGRDGHCMAVPAFRSKDVVVSAKDYLWFSELRKSIRRNLNILTFDFTNRDTLYSDKTKVRAVVGYYPPALDLLLRNRSCNTITDLNAKLAFDNLCKSFPKVPYDVLLCTALIFTERKTMSQKRLVATVDANAEFLADKTRYVPPMENTVLSGNSVSDTVRELPQGVYNFTTVEECRQHHSAGKTCVKRVEYTKSDSSYGSISSPSQPAGRKFELVRCTEGAGFRDPYISFTTESEREKGYASVGVTFANQADVIDQYSKVEVERALLRITLPRDNEVDARARASVYNDLLFETILSLCTQQEIQIVLTGKHDLAEIIKDNDRDYVGGVRIVEDYEDLYGRGSYGKLRDAMLQEADFRDFLLVQANIMYASAQAYHAPDGAIFDAHQTITEYVDEIGSKVPLRKRMIREFFEEQVGGERKRYNVAQLKPMELQKWKPEPGTGRMRLKFARLVVSITGSDWLRAAPATICDLKMHLERPVGVYYRPEGNGVGVICTVQIDEVIREFNVEKQHMDFYYEACLTRTKNVEIAEVITRMEEFCSRTNTCAATTHGDDMLLCCRYANGNFRWIEGDIADNDGSHCDSSFNVARTVDLLAGCDTKEAFAQCANPIMMVNPSNSREHVVLRSRYGMYLPSGSVNTTRKNTFESRGICLSFSILDNSDIKNAAIKVGFNVTQVVGHLEDVSFLSKCFGVDDSNSVVAISDFGSILRSLGTFHGDFPGKSSEPVDKRAMRHFAEVVSSYVNEPDTLLLRVLRNSVRNTSITKYVSSYMQKQAEQTSFVQRLGNLIKEACIPEILGECDLTKVDEIMLDHYYPETEGKAAQGRADYLWLCNAIRSQTNLYGTTFHSHFVDACMKKRYGLAPACV